MTSYTAPAVRVPSGDVHGVQVVFVGVEQAGPSFEGRVFLNRPGADASTSRTPENGYVGSFHLFGYGRHMPPALAEAKAVRAEGGEPVAPIEKRVRVDAQALRTALHGAAELVVTVVTIPAEPGDAVSDQPFQNVRIVFDHVGPPSATQTT
jgi:hypothetical protein